LAPAAHREETGNAAEAGDLLVEEVDDDDAGGEASPGSEPDPGRWSAVRSRLATLDAVVVAAFVVPLGVWVWRVIGFGNRFRYWSDNANIELNTLDVGREFVAIGAYSRMVWSHPGPLASYLLAIPSRLGGESSVGLALGALALNAAAVAGILVLARRRGGTPLLVLTAAMLTVFLHGLGPAFLVDVWNPSLPVLPFALLLFLCWGVALQERWSLPPAVAIASFCAQAHVGYVVVATLPLLAAVLVGVLSTWPGPSEERRARLRSWLRPAVVALVVGLVLWSPPIVDEITERPGNFRLLQDYFDDTNGEPPAGLGKGWGRQRQALGIEPTWVTGEPPTQLTFLDGWRVSPDPPVILLALAVGVLLAVRRRDRAGIIGAAIAAVGVATGIFAGSRITGFMYFYLTRWSMAVGWFAALVAVWLLVSALIEWRPAFRRPTVAAASAVLVIMAALFTSNAVHEPNPQEAWGPVARDLADQVQENLPPGDGPVQFEESGSFSGMAHRSALIVALERAGIETSVENQNPITHGKWRTGIADDPRVTLMVAVDEQIAEYEAAGYRVIAAVRPQSAEERRATERFLADVRQRLDEGDHPSWEELERAANLNEVHAMAVLRAPEDAD
jgi:hypothetical protein